MSGKTREKSGNLKWMVSGNPDSPIEVICCGQYQHSVLLIYRNIVSYWDTQNINFPLSQMEN